MCPKITDIVRNGSARKKPDTISKTHKTIPTAKLTVDITSALCLTVLEIMRFVQDQNVRFKLGNLIAHLLGLRHLVIRKDFYLALNATPFIKLTTPVDLGDGGADHNDFLQAELITSRDHLNSLT